MECIVYACLSGGVGLFIVDTVVPVISGHSSTCN